MNSEDLRVNFNAPSISEIADMFPHHKIDSLIAQGGMGAVYLAVQESLDRKVAIKVLPDEFGSDPGYREAFQAEARTMAKINNPNLVSIFDFGSYRGMLFIIMEYADGESLYHLSQKEDLDHHYVAKVGSEIAFGLAAAHEAGILHRDIKPSNILLNSKRQAKISDFGLARPNGETESGVIYGTPGYTAPEVLKSPDSVDIQADIFSVGVIVYELLTKTMPSKAYMPVNALVGATNDFDNIIRKAIHPSPKMRYRSAQTLAEDLKELAEFLKPPSETDSQRLVTGRVTTRVTASASKLNPAPTPQLKRPAISTANAPAGNTGPIPQLKRPGVTTSSAPITQSSPNPLLKRTSPTAQGATPVTEKPSGVAKLNVDTSTQGQTLVNPAISAESVPQSVTPKLMTAEAATNAAGQSRQVPGNRVPAGQPLPTPKVYNKSFITNIVIIAVLATSCVFAWKFIQEKKAKADEIKAANALAEAAEKERAKNGSNSRTQEISVSDKTNKTGSRSGEADRGAGRGGNISPGESTGDDTISLEAKKRTSHEKAYKQLQGEQLNLLNGIINADKLPNNTFTRGNSFYLYINQAMTWHEADSFCSMFGGQIATCEHLADAEFLKRSAQLEDGFWLGGGATPEKEIAHIDQSPFKIRIAAVYGSRALCYYSGSNVELKKPNAKLTFFIQWNKNGAMHSSVDTRLARLYPSLAQIRPNFPPTTFTSGGHTYLVLYKKMTFTQAEDLARMAGGNLAVISRPGEATALASYLKDAIPNNTPLWLGYKRSSSNQWIPLTVENNVQMPWLNAPQESDRFASVLHDQGTIGLEASSAETLNGCVIEWSKDESEAYTSNFIFEAVGDINTLRDQARNMLQLRNDYFNYQLRLCPMRLAWIIRTWKGSATKAERDAQDRPLSAIIKTILSDDSIPKNFDPYSLPRPIVDQAVAAIDQQKALFASHKKQLKIIREGYLQALKGLYNSEPNKRGPRAQEIQSEAKRHYRSPDKFEELLQQ